MYAPAMPVAFEPASKIAKPAAIAAGAAARRAIPAARAPRRNHPFEFFTRSSLVLPRPSWNRSRVCLKQRVDSLPLPWQSQALRPSGEARALMPGEKNVQKTGSADPGRKDRSPEDRGERSRLGAVPGGGRLVEPPDRRRVRGAEDHIGSLNA